MQHDATDAPSLVFAELASLWPRLLAALPRDSGRADGTPTTASTHSGAAAPALVLNLDVVEARDAIVRGTRRAFDEIAPLLNLNPRRARTVEQLISALPHWHAALVRAEQPFARYLLDDVSRWLTRARDALGLRSRTERIGWLCPHHRDEPTQLVRERDEAVLAPSVIAGRAQRTDADGHVVEAPLTWRHGVGVRCPSCRQRWAGDTELRVLLRMIEAADATTIATGRLDTIALATALGRDAQTIRAWASRGRLTRRGTDSRGRALYDLEEARRVSDSAPRRNRNPTNDDAPPLANQGRGGVGVGGSYEADDS